MANIFIAAGGTGGHIIPAMTIADELMKAKHQIFWLGSKFGLETKLLINKNYTTYFMPLKGVRGRSLIAKISAILNIIITTFKTLMLFSKTKPKFVLCMGGFVSMPAGIAAKFLKIPLIIHEQNSIPGFTNKILAKFATKTLEAFKGSFPENIKAIHTGNPIRNNLTQIKLPKDRINLDKNKSLKLLVIGGSRGASKLNDIIVQLSKTFDNKQLEIWHQTGQKDLTKIQQQYNNNNFTAKVEPFINDMASAFAWPDIVICRAGALTCAELSAVGLASILVPYPYAVDDHQTSNAQALVKAGSAILIPEKDLTLDLLSNKINYFINNRTKILAMAQAGKDINSNLALTSIMKFINT